MCEINGRKAVELMQLSNNCQVTTVSDIDPNHNNTYKMTTVNIDLQELSTSGHSKRN